MSFPNSLGKKWSGCAPNGFPTTRKRVGVSERRAGAAARVTDSSIGRDIVPPNAFSNVLRSSMFGPYLGLWWMVCSYTARCHTII